MFSWPPREDKTEFEWFSFLFVGIAMFSSNAKTECECLIKKVILASGSE